MVPDSQMDQLGAEAFEQLKAKETVDRTPVENSYVRCVVNPLIEMAKAGHFEAELPENWEVVVFKSDTVNAFALPGGKIGVYTEILKVAKTDSQLAAVLGHEIGHVLARHGAERMSQEAGTQLGMAALGHIAKDNPHRDLYLGVLGLGAKIGILLPYSRTQESEADLIGLDLMARAGFDPRESVELWKNMSTASGGHAPPEILSTHPSNDTRIQSLQSHVPAALTLYDQAKASGHKPVCTR